MLASGRVREKIFYPKQAWQLTFAGQHLQIKLSSPFACNRIVSMSFNPPDVKTLRRLRPLSQFSDEQLQSLANQLSVATAAKREVLIERGCTEQFYLFVLQGSIQLTAGDGKQQQLTITDKDSLNPIAQLRPSLYRVTASESLKYLRIDSQLMTQFAQQVEEGGEDISVHIIENDSDDNALALSLYQDLIADRITLPSLPEVAQRIQQVYADENIDAERVSAILMLDPAISAKLIKIANSPVYQGLSATQTLQAAIVRLGLGVTYKQVMAYAVNELFRGQSGSISKRMNELWTHSRRVAAISRVLAKTTGLFDPEEAMLAGLTHDLGVIVILEYIQKFHDSEPDQELIERTVQTMRPQITGLLMRKWNFSAEVAKVAEECENWFRNPRDEADLCDLVLIAQCHAMMGSDRMSQIPPITTLPAMTKLKMGPKESVELLKQSSKEIREVEKLLG
jgi:HD-like signal output (HDOD) protein